MNTPAPEFAQYRRVTLAELRPYAPGEDLGAVSVGDNCAAAGGPVAGDWIARDPYNHADQWIVLASYFVEHFTPRVRPSLGPRGPIERLAELVGCTRAELAERIVVLERHSRNLTSELTSCRQWLTGSFGVLADQILRLTRVCEEGYKPNPDHEPET